MINIPATGSPFIFSFYLDDKGYTKGDDIWLKMERVEDNSKRYFELTDTSTSPQYSQFIIDPSDLKGGDYNATLQNGMTGQVYLTSKGRVGGTGAQIPTTTFTATTNKIVFNG